jgi:hypothetical protein
MRNRRYRKYFLFSIMTVVAVMAQECSCSGAGQSVTMVEINPATQTAQVVGLTQAAIRRTAQALVTNEAATEQAQASATALSITQAAAAATRAMEQLEATEAAATATEVARQFQTQEAARQTQAAITPVVTEAVVQTELRVEDIDPPRDCMNAEALDEGEYEEEDNLESVEFSSEGVYLVVRAIYHAQALEAAMRATGMLYGLTVGVYDPSRDAPPENPANEFAAAANFYYQVQWFLLTGTIIEVESIFDQGQWQTTTLNQESILQFNGNEARVLIPLKYFPEEGYLFAGVVRDNRVCDYAGMDPDVPHRPFIHYVVIGGVGQFEELEPPVQLP